MTIQFRPAVREHLPLLIGVCGGTGSGKTMSAMEMATGLTPKGERFAVIDTENGRALHYADRYAFDHGDLRAPFTPQAYLEAAQAAAKAGYKVILIDSMSHEWAGTGGVLDMHEAELDRMAGDNWEKRAALTIAAWIKPKGEHKKMVQAFLQINAHIIFCFRAESKIEMDREMMQNGRMKTVIRERVGPTGYGGWFPVTEKNLPFELTVSMMMLAENPGMPQPIKVEDQFRLIIPPTRFVTADAGRLFGEWASGAAAPAAKAPAPTQTRSAPPAAPRAATPAEKPLPPAEIRNELGNVVPSNPPIEPGDPTKPWVDENGVVHMPGEDEPSELPFDDDPPAAMENVIAQRTEARKPFQPPSGNWFDEMREQAKTMGVSGAHLKALMQKPTNKDNVYAYLIDRKLTWPVMLKLAAEAPV